MDTRSRTLVAATAWVTAVVPQSAGAAGFAGRATFELTDVVDGTPLTVPFDEPAVAGALGPPGSTAGLHVQVEFSPDGAERFATLAWTVDLGGVTSNDIERQGGATFSLAEGNLSARYSERREGGAELELQAHSGTVRLLHLVPSPPRWWGQPEAPVLVAARFDVAFADERGVVVRTFANGTLSVVGEDLVDFGQPRGAGNHGDGHDAGEVVVQTGIYLAHTYDDGGCGGDDPYPGTGSASASHADDGCEGDTYDDTSSDSGCEGDSTSSDSGCEGDSTSSDSGCEGDSTSSDSGCESDSSSSDSGCDDSDSGCEGDAYAAAQRPARRRASPVVRTFDRVLPWLIAGAAVHVMRRRTA
jgi:hypothetical protein